jgi:hypothetical protein
MNKALQKKANAASGVSRAASMAMQSGAKTWQTSAEKAVD